MIPTIVRKRNSAIPSIFDELLNDNFLPGFFNTESSFSNTKNSPAVNVEETENEFKIDLAAPGINKEDIKVAVDDGVLTLSAEKKIEPENKKDGFLRREFNFGSFSRSFNLPENTNGDKVSATYKNGVLNVSIPKEKVVVIPAKEIKIS